MDIEIYDKYNEILKNTDLTFSLKHVLLCWRLLLKIQQEEVDYFYYEFIDLQFCKNCYLKCIDYMNYVIETFESIINEQFFNTGLKPPYEWKKSDFYIIWDCAKIKYGDSMCEKNKCSQTYDDVYKQKEDSFLQKELAETINVPYRLQRIQDEAMINEEPYVPASLIDYAMKIGKICNDNGLPKPCIVSNDGRLSLQWGYDIYFTIFEDGKISFSDRLTNSRIRSDMDDKNILDMLEKSLIKNLS